MEPRLGPKREDGPGAVGRGLHALGDPAIGRGRFVIGVGKKPRKGEAQAIRRHALEDEGVEVIKGANGRQPHLLALERARVGVV
jgi:hypothetical protein